jgi:hypothetical protein
MIGIINVIKNLATLFSFLQWMSAFRRIVKAVTEWTDKIKSGAIKVPGTLAEFKTFTNK